MKKIKNICKRQHLRKRCKPGKTGIRKIKIWAYAENPVKSRGYGNRREMIRVDTLRKVVIIVTGGKIGNPFLLGIIVRIGRGATKTTHLDEHGAVVNREQEVLRCCQGIGERQFKDDIGPTNVLRRGVGGDLHSCDWRNAGKGWTNV